MVCVDDGLACPPKEDPCDGAPYVDDGAPYDDDGRDGRCGGAEYEECGAGGGGAKNEDEEENECDDECDDGGK